MHGIFKFDYKNNDIALIDMKNVFMYPSINYFDPNINYSGNIIDSVMKGFGNITDRKYIIKYNIIGLKCFQTDYNLDLDLDSDSCLCVMCEICDCTYKNRELYFVCNNEKCRKPMCYKCISKYYNDNNRINKNLLRCIFCRNILDFDIFMVLFKKLLYYSEILPMTLYNDLIDDKVYYHCEIFSNVDILKENIICDAIGNNNNDAKLLCKKCNDDYPIKVKKCPYCDTSVVRRDTRLDGCHYMRCMQCRKNWCWFRLAKLGITHTWTCEVNGCTN
jgi:hypothetical protein